MVGVAMDGSTGRMDNFIVQILPPDWTIDETDDFAPPAELTRTVANGIWDESSDALTGTANATGPAVQLIELGASLAANSILEMEVDITSGDTAGYPSGTTRSGLEFEPRPRRAKLFLRGSLARNCQTVVQPNRPHSR